jgi:peroxiredoxin family protein
LRLGDRTGRPGGPPGGRRGRPGPQPTKESRPETGVFPLPGPQREGAKARKLTIIAWSGDLDRAYPILILATTAAASGMQVTVFFTFWGLFILKRNDRRFTGRDWMTRMLSLMNRGGTEHLKLSRLHMGGMGTWMMRRIFRKNRIPSLEELLTLARETGVRLIPCQMTMDALGLRREDLIEGVGPPAGAATAIAEAAESAVSWFI